MALIDIVKCDEQGNDWIVHKYPSNELRLGTQLIVNESQKAILVKNGQVFDIFESGRYTLSTSNIPLLNSVINLPFGGNSPFTAEIWFFSTLNKRDQKWGTPNPINVTDYGSGMSIDARSFGNWGYQLVNPTAFYQKFIGATANFHSDELKKQFDSMLLQKFTVSLAGFIEDRQISVTKLMAYLDEVSSNILNSIATELALYGIEVSNFNISSLTFDQIQLERVRSVEFERMKVEKLGQVQVSNSYQVIRNLDIMEAAANNQNGVAAAGMSTGLGLGAGLNMFSAVQQNNQNVQQQTNGPTPEERLLKLKKLFDAGLITDDELKAKRLEILSLI
jgi:membrane protease subunit (stomatin/prohibitin family)